MRTMHETSSQEMCLTPLERPLMWETLFPTVHGFYDTLIWLLMMEEVVIHGWYPEWFVAEAAANASEFEDRTVEA